MSREAPWAFCHTHRHALGRNELFRNPAVSARECNAAHYHLSRCATARGGKEGQLLRAPPTTLRSPLRPHQSPPPPSANANDAALLTKATQREMDELRVRLQQSRREVAQLRGVIAELGRCMLTPHRPPGPVEGKRPTLLAVLQAEQRHACCNSLDGRPLGEGIE